MNRTLVSTLLLTVILFSATVGQANGMRTKDDFTGRIVASTSTFIDLPESTTAFLSFLVMSSGIPESKVEPPSDFFGVTFDSLSAFERPYLEIKLNDDVDNFFRLRAKEPPVKQDKGWYRAGISFADYREAQTFSRRLMSADSVSLRLRYTDVASGQEKTFIFKIEKKDLEEWKQTMITVRTK